MKQKIVYEDAGENKAVVGTIESQDSDFITGIDNEGRRFQINKKHIVIIRDWRG